MTKFIKIFSTIAVLLSVVWGGLMIYWGDYCPTILNEKTGHIYAYNYHGTIVYLNIGEEILLYALPGVAFLIFFSLLVVEYYQRKNDKKWPPDDIYGK